MSGLFDWVKISAKLSIQVNVILEIYFADIKKKKINIFPPHVENVKMTRGKVLLPDV